MASSPFVECTLGKPVSQYEVKRITDWHLNEHAIGKVGE